MYQVIEVWAPLYRLIEAGAVVGGTDEFGFSPNEKIEVYDIQATLLHLQGIDPFEVDAPVSGARFPVDIHGRVLKQLLV